ANPLAVLIARSSAALPRYSRKGGPQSLWSAGSPCLNMKSALQLNPWRMQRPEEHNHWRAPATNEKTDTWHNSGFWSFPGWPDRRFGRGAVCLAKATCAELQGITA